MTAPCNTCSGPLRFYATTTGQTREVCEQCGYAGLLRLAVPRPVVITDAERSPEPSMTNGVLTTRTCAVCGADYQTPARRPRATCTNVCRDRWRRSHPPTVKRPAVAGEKNGAAKLTPKIVDKIRTSPRVSGATWAAKLGVSRQTIFKIRRGLTW